jgi:hypothetical protein
MWTRIKNWFRNSETIFWSRLQVLVGSLWVALSASDLSPLLNPKYMAIWLIFNGFITEYLRRRSTETVTVPPVVPGEPPVVKLVSL